MSSPTSLLVSLSLKFDLRLARANQVRTKVPPIYTNSLENGGGLSGALLESHSHRKGLTYTAMGDDCTSAQVLGSGKQVEVEFAEKLGGGGGDGINHKL